MKFQTKTIHAGGKEKNPENALNYPIFQTSTFVFDNLEHVEKVMNFESDDFVYTRGNNPTLRVFEERMTHLEEGAGAVAFSSGMAAISSTLFSLLKPGDTLIANRTLYGSTYNVCTSILPQYGVQVKLVDLTDPDELLANLDEKTKAVYFETPSNPSLSIIDIRKISQIAHSHGAKVVVDNTFATPFFQRPLTLGADVVVHSATKYIGGHGDAVAGVAVAKDLDYVMNLKFGYMCEFGGVMSPFNSFLLIRGLKTLSLRMREHAKNAAAAADLLANHPLVTTVNYPGLENFKGHEIAKSQMDGFGAMISFEVEGGLEKAKRVVESMKLFKLAVSLGDCESLIELPAAMTHRGYDREALAEFGLSESMIRISVGLEDQDDILNDLAQALER